MRKIPYARLLMWLTLSTFGGCTFILDFDSECESNLDCAPGDRCEIGFCVARDLVETGRCAVHADCLEFGSDVRCDMSSNQCVEAGGDAVKTLCDTLMGVDPRTAKEDTVITLGALLPKTGPLASYGRGMEQGLHLAIAEINQQGGVAARKIAVLSCDSGTDSARGIRATEHLVHAAKVQAIIGAGASGVTIDSFNAVARDNGVLMMSPSATSPALTNQVDNGLLWRTAPSDAVQAASIARYISAKGYQKVAIVSRDDVYGMMLSVGIEDELCAAGSGFQCGDGGPGVQPILRRVYTEHAGATQVSEQREIIEGSNGLDSFQPDVVVLLSYPEDGISFLNQLGTRVYPMILADGMREPEVIDAVDNRDLVCRAIGTVPASPSGAHYARFRSQYESVFKESPPTYAPNSYDAAYLLALAYAAAEGAGERQPDGRGLAEGLTRLSAGDEYPLQPQQFSTAVSVLRGASDSTINVSGISGPLDFDPATGEASSGVEMWRFEPAEGKIDVLGVVSDGEGRYDMNDVLALPVHSGCQAAP